MSPTPFSRDIFYLFHVLTVDLISSGRIAKGVALAASNCLTVEQFMARGAAFGRQMKQSANRGNTNPDDQWDNFAPFLLSQVRRHSIETPKFYVN